MPRFWTDEVGAGTIWHVKAYRDLFMDIDMADLAAAAPESIDFAANATPERKFSAVPAATKAPGLAVREAEARRRAVPAGTKVSGHANSGNVNVTGTATANVETESGDRYIARFYPAWESYPSGDLEADVRRMNAFIEDRVREMPEQYFWAHKRFKTRPPGEPNPYRRRR